MYGLKLPVGTEVTVTFACGDYKKHGLIVGHTQKNGFPQYIIEIKEQKKVGNGIFTLKLYTGEEECVRERGK